MRHKIKNYTILQPTIIKPTKIGCFGYVFFNTGETNVLINIDNTQPIILIPGQTMDTRNIGTIDITVYNISFNADPSLATNSQQGSLNVTIFERA